MGTPPSMTSTALLSKYKGMFLAKKQEQAGANSEGFRTAAFPAAMAPISGSNASPVAQTTKQFS